MMSRVRLAVPVLALALTGATLGAEPGEFDDKEEKEPLIGWYAGGAIGGFRFLPETTAALTSNTAGGGFGSIGYLFQDNYGLELRVGGTGDRSSVQNLPGVPLDFPFTFGSVLGKFGTSRINRIQLYLVGGVTAGAFTTRAGGNSETKASVSYGGGIDGDFGEHFSVGVEIIRYISAVEFGPGRSLNTDGLTGSARWHF